MVDFTELLSSNIAILTLCFTEGVKKLVNGQLDTKWLPFIAVGFGLTFGLLEYGFLWIGAVKGILSGFLVTTGVSLVDGRLIKLVVKKR